MIMYLTLLLFLLNAEFNLNYAQTNIPEQIHLSLGANSSQIIVTWVTAHQLSSTPKVEFGVSSLDTVAEGSTTLFTDSGSEKRKMYIHRVILTELKMRQKYIYRCGSDEAWSASHAFTTLVDDRNWSPKFAIYGDLGKVNDKSIPALTEDVRNSEYDVIFHVGDFAYDMHTDNARYGDDFMRLIEPIAANVPYMTVPGNHEIHSNFSNYDNRFTMVSSVTGEHNNHYYSLNIGSAHIVMFSTEFYYATTYGWDQIQRQYEWLERDLKEANSAENREIRPWIITMGHRPLYCAKVGDDSCDEKKFERTLIRNGIKIKNAGEVLYGLESLFYKYGVDLQFYGHEHYYHRMFPVYNNHIYNGSAVTPYYNSNAPIHIITGSAGCQELHAKFNSPLPSWSAFRNSDYGYTRMTLHNATHISLDQVSDDKNGQVVDSVSIVKEKHGTYTQ